MVGSIIAESYIVGNDLWRSRTTGLEASLYTRALRIDATISFTRGPSPVRNQMQDQAHHYFEKREYLISDMCV